MVEDLEGRQVLSTIGLDPTFGFGGTTMQSAPPNTGTTSFYQSTTSIAAQNGKVVEVGTLDRSTGGTDTYRMFVTRFNSDGSIDTTFGSGGTQYITVASGGVTYDVHADDIVVQSDGKIDVLGTAETTAPNASDLVVARLDANGQPDATFGTSGFRLIDFSTITGSPSPGSTAAALALDPGSGKIVAVGQTPTATVVRDFAIARLNTDGSLDTSFNTTGMVAIPFGTGGVGQLNIAAASSVVVQPDSKVVVAGSAGLVAMGSPGGKAAVVRLNTDGTLDTSFNGTGRFTYTYNLGGGSNDIANAVALQGSQIVIAGTSHLSVPPGSNLNVMELTVTRLNANGSFDNTFNGGGKFILSTTLGGVDLNTSASAVNVLPDGSILVGGDAHQKNTYGSNYNAALVKLTSGGALDPNFGSGGVALLPTYMEGRMLVQDDGKVLFAIYDGVARTTAPTPEVASSTIMTTPNGKKATGLTIHFNTGINPDLARNFKVYEIRTVKGKKLVKIKKNAITYDAATRTLTIKLPGKFAMGKGFQVVISPGAVVGADGQVLKNNTIIISPPTT